MPPPKIHSTLVHCTVVHSAPVQLGAPLGVVKVGQLERSVRHQEHVIRLDVEVGNIVSMHDSEATCRLEEDGLQGGQRHG